MPIIKINAFCNQKCVFCSDKSRPALPGRSFSAAGLKVKKGGLVQISGGEPLLSFSAELLGFILGLVKKNRRVEFQTNGVLLEKIPEERLAVLVSLVKKSGGYFNVNFSSGGPAVDYAVTGLKGAYAARLRGLKILAGFKVPVRLTFVVNKLNFRGLPAFVRLVSGELPFVSWVQFSFIKGAGRAASAPSLIPEYGEVAPFLLRALKHLEKAGINSETDHIPLCFLGVYWRKSVDVEKMISKKKGPHLSEKKKPAACRPCVLFPFCSGPRKDYLKIYPGFNKGGNLCLKKK